MLPQYKNKLTTIITDSVIMVVNLFKELKTIDFVMPSISLERPKLNIHGDYSCNVAMQISRFFKQKPFELANLIVKFIRKYPSSSDIISSINVANPGFINIHLSSCILQETVLYVLNKGSKFGHHLNSKNYNTILEFVSANPTGPLHIGHGRQAVLGDILGNLLESQGYKVWREFYYNDTGNQINNLVLSVQARAQGLQPGDINWPKSAYNGNYVNEIAQDFLARTTLITKSNQKITANGNIKDIENIRNFAVSYLRNEQDIDLQILGIKFDHFFLESSLYENGKVKNTVQALIKSGFTYEKDGAIWLKSTYFNDDKDRVICKSDGTYTYFISDITYHISKWERGYLKAINIQGTDHHSTITRVRAGLQALGIGIPPYYPDYILHSMVRVQYKGKELKISKRTGNYITLRELVKLSANNKKDFNNITDNYIQRGRDAIRFFLISRKADTEFIFDVDLANKRNQENPVFYVQYAYARICSVLSAWNNKITTLHKVNLKYLEKHQLSVQLIKRISEFPEILAQASRELTPHILAFYLRELASDLHMFYNNERILVDDEQVCLARITLLMAVKQVLVNGLKILGISAPMRM